MDQSSIDYKMATVSSAATTDIDPMDFRCSICLSTLHRPVTLCCGHSLCEHCFASFLHNFLTTAKQTMRCPVACNTSLVPKFPAVNTILNNHIQQIFPADEAKNQQQYMTENHQHHIVNIRNEIILYAKKRRRRKRRRRRQPRPNNEEEQNEAGNTNEDDLADDLADDFDNDNIFDWISYAMNTNYTTVLPPRIAQCVTYLHNSLDEYVHEPPLAIATTYASLFSWGMFIAFAMLLVTLQLHHSSTSHEPNAYNVSGPYPNSTSSFMYLNNPIQDLPTFYTQYSLSCGHVTGNNEKDQEIEQATIQTTSADNNNYNAPLNQLLTEPNTIQMSDWLDRNSQSPFWFSKRHFTALVFMVPIFAGPRTAATLWLFYSSNSAISSFLLNPQHLFGNCNNNSNSNSNSNSNISKNDRRHHG